MRLERRTPVFALAIAAFATGCSSQQNASEFAGPDASSDASHAGEVPQFHRSSAVACAPAAAASEPDPSGVMFGDCTKNADCTAGKEGACIGDLVHGSRCVYDLCTVDSDCTKVSLRVCACGANSGRNMCAGGNCAVDADCGAGGYCSPSPGDSNGSLTGYFCHAPSDACIKDSDCTQSTLHRCGYRNGGWLCFSPGGD